MKSLILKSSIIGLTIFAANVANAGETKVPVYLEKDLVNVCEAIQKNDVRNFRRHVENTGVNIRALQKGLRCNGMDMTSFAIANNAAETATLIAKRTGQDQDKILAMIESDGVATTLAAK